MHRQYKIIFAYPGAVVDVGVLDVLAGVVLQVLDVVLVQVVGVDAGSDKTMSLSLY